MRTQLHNWRILVDHIIDKIWEYIDEIEYFGESTKIWIDASEDSVILNDEGQKFDGECRPVEQFITIEEDGRREPNVDAIEDFAYGWFDLRQV